jgi:hypothetical protein
MAYLTGSPVSPPSESSGSATSPTVVLPHHHTGEPISKVDDNDGVEDDDNGDVISDHKPERDPHDPHEHKQGHWRLCMPTSLRFSRDVGVDVDTRHMEATAAAVVAVRCASGAQVCIDNDNDKKKQRQYLLHNPIALESSGGRNFACCEMSRALRSIERLVTASKCHVEYRRMMYRPRE